MSAFIQCSDCSRRSAAWESLRLIFSKASLTTWRPLNAGTLGVVVLRLYSVSEVLRSAAKATGTCEGNTRTPRWSSASVTHRECPDRSTCAPARRSFEETTPNKKGNWVTSSQELVLDILTSRADTLLECFRVFYWRRTLEASNVARMLRTWGASFM